jgi:hypothetical protein
MQAAFVFWFALRRSHEWRWANAVTAVIGTTLLLLVVIAITGATPIFIYVVVAWPAIWLSAVLAGASPLWRALAVGIFLPPLALALDLFLGRLGLYGSYNLTM